MTAMENVTNRLGDNVKKKLELSAQTNKLRQAIKQQIKVQNTSAGSIGRVNAELAIEKKRILDIEIGSRKFDKVAQRIKQLETKQRDFSEVLGRGRTFVGEYEKGTSAGFKKIANTSDKTNKLLFAQREEIKKLVVGSKKFNVVAGRIRQLELQQKKFNAQVKKSTSDIVGSFQKTGLAIGGAVVVFGTRQRISTGAIDVVKEFDDAIANLRKTTGQSKESAEALARVVNKIDTKTSITNLLALASAAGRLGLAGQDIIDFTKSVDKAFAALVDSFECDDQEKGLTF